MHFTYVGAGLVIIYIPIIFVDLLLGEVCIYSRRDFFLFFINDDLVPQSLFFSLGQWQYDFFTQKDVKISNLYITEFKEQVTFDSN